MDWSWFPENLRDNWLIMFLEIGYLKLENLTILITNTGWQSQCSGCLLIAYLVLSAWFRPRRWATYI